MAILNSSYIMIYGRPLRLHMTVMVCTYSIRKVDFDESHCCGAGTLSPSSNNPLDVSSYNALNEASRYLTALTSFGNTYPDAIPIVETNVGNSVGVAFF